MNPQPETIAEAGAATASDVDAPTGSDIGSATALDEEALPDGTTAADSAADPEPPAAITTAVTTTAVPDVREPLVSAEAEQRFLDRWAEIQIAFVEDPAASARDADALIQEIGEAILAAITARRAALAPSARQGTPEDTEELRLALRRYRSFLGVLLPK